MSMDMDDNQASAPPPQRDWRAVLHEVIFEADTYAGKLFDVLLIACIVASVTVVMLNSVRGIHQGYGAYLARAEWGFTILFTIEYVLRLLCVRRAMGYATSFYGVVDLLAVVPTYISLFVPGSQVLSVVRILRVLRVFQVLDLGAYLGEARILARALRASRRKITVFLLAVLTLVVIMGSLMYVIEGGGGGFTSIPRSVYWAIVTLTTVGYGDISPQTAVGQALSAVIMILGYSIIVIPTGLVSVEMARSEGGDISTQVCRQCNAEGHDRDAAYCKHCGARL
jgi:voltage-gated potassium channel